MRCGSCLLLNCVIHLLEGCGPPALPPAATLVGSADSVLLPPPPPAGSSSADVPASRGWPAGASLASGPGSAAAGAGSGPAAAAAAATRACAMAPAGWGCPCAACAAGAACAAAATSLAAAACLRWMHRWMVLRSAVHRSRTSVSPARGGAQGEAGWRKPGGAAQACRLFNHHTGMRCKQAGGQWERGHRSPSLPTHRWRPAARACSPPSRW